VAASASENGPRGEIVNDAVMSGSVDRVVVDGMQLRPSVTSLEQVSE
jgi:hypothetical protein